MSTATVSIKRYPNRRYYSRNSSKYVSLQEIEEMIQAGQTVDIRDSQTGEDLTRAVLTQIIIERQPDKMLLFPTDMLHCILRSNDMMAGFLRDYFGHSLTYLNYLQRHSSTATTLADPMHWVKAWMESIANGTPAGDASPASNGPVSAEPLLNDPAPSGAVGETSGLEVRATQLAERVEQLEARLRQLEAKTA